MASPPPLRGMVSANSLIPVVVVSLVGVHSSWPRINPNPAQFERGDFTVVEHCDPGNRGLQVQPVSTEEQATVRRAGGYLFATATEADKFARDELLYGDRGPPVARQGFSHRRVGGLRIYIYFGQSI